jgi:hypothetical protein
VLAAALLACLPVAVPIAAGPVENPAYVRIEAVPLAGRDRGSVAQWVLYLDGPIESGADRRLADFIEQQHIGRAAVYFNSPGGSLLAGMAVGRVLRGRGFTTDVGRRTADPRRPSTGVCYSACPFAYAGGVLRSLRAGSVLGVHRAHNRLPVPDEETFERRVEADATAYLRAMGVDPGLVALMRESPPGEIRLLGAAELRALGLVNQGPAMQPRRPR